jgi:hypothetical protein
MLREPISAKRWRKRIGSSAGSGERPLDSEWLELLSFIRCDDLGFIESIRHLSSGYTALRSRRTSESTTSLIRILVPRRIDLPYRTEQLRVSVPLLPSRLVRRSRLLLSGWQQTCMEWNRGFYGPALRHILEGPRTSRVVDEFRDIESAAKDYWLAMLVCGYDKSVPRWARLLRTLSGVWTANTLLRSFNGGDRSPPICVKSIWAKCNSLNCWSVPLLTCVEPEGRRFGASGGAAVGSQSESEL